MPSEHRSDEAETHQTSASGPGETFPIGFYIGAILLVVGLVVLVTGLVAPAPRHLRGIDFNRDLWWGLVVVLTGCVTLGLTWISPRRRAISRAASQPR